MTEEEAAPDDETYAEVSALLAEARHRDTVPAHVLARLDATLAELTAGRGSGAGDGTTAETTQTAAEVVPLSWRRRLAPKLLAAAVVVVLGGAGVGLAHVVGNRHHGSLTSSDVAGGPVSSSAPTVPQARPEQPRSHAESQDKGEDSLAQAYAGVPVFSAADFASQVATYLGASDSAGTLDLRKGTTGSTGTGGGTAGTTPVPSPADGAATPTAGEVRSPLAGATATKACPGPADPGGAVTPIHFDGLPAVLVVHPVVDHDQLVQAWSCDGASVLATAVLAR